MILVVGGINGDESTGVKIVRRLSVVLLKQILIKVLD